MFVANVGDSRAIICAQQPGEKSTVRPLSVDQTPFRKDERTRIKQAGGHVLTIDQIEGLEVGRGVPPKGWVRRAYLNSHISYFGVTEEFVYNRSCRFLPPALIETFRLVPLEAYSRELGHAVGRRAG